MSHILYHKLVRDKVPEMIMERGWRCQVVELTEEEYHSMLDKKLQGELDEYKESKSLEELADLLEVLMAVAEARGSYAKVEAIRQVKREERGAFDKRIFLKTVGQKD